MRWALLALPLLLASDTTGAQATAPLNHDVPGDVTWFGPMPLGPSNVWGIYCRAPFSSGRAAPMLMDFGPLGLRIQMDVMAAVVYFDAATPPLTLVDLSYVELRSMSSGPATTVLPGLCRSAVLGRGATLRLRPGAGALDSVWALETVPETQVEAVLVVVRIGLEQ